GAGGATTRSRSSSPWAPPWRTWWPQRWSCGTTAGGTMGVADVAERYLELLAEDRPAEALEGLLRRELEAGVDEAALVRVHDLALRVHSLHQTGRRRESELVALH